MVSGDMSKPRAKDHGTFDRFARSLVDEAHGDIAA